MIDEVVRWFATGDGLISSMGPLLTFILAALGGGFLAQWLKFPLDRVFLEPWFSWMVRLVAFAGSVVFAHVLSASLTWPLEVMAGLASLALYHGGIGLIRHFWPWLEVIPMIGSAAPDDSAYMASAVRQMTKQATSLDKDIAARLRGDK